MSRHPGTERLVLTVFGNEYLPDSVFYGDRVRVAYYGAVSGTAGRLNWTISIVTNLSDESLHSVDLRDEYERHNMTLEGLISMESLTRLLELNMDDNTLFGHISRPREINPVIKSLSR